MEHSESQTLPTTNGSSWCGTEGEGGFAFDILEVDWFGAYLPLKEKLLCTCSGRVLGCLEAGSVMCLCGFGMAQFP